MPLLYSILPFSRNLHLCHKQYESCIPVQISVYEDRLYIANCGKLPENWTIDSLMSKHASRPYNPSIANVYYLAGLIESWGRGIEKICQACEEDGSPLPEYTIHPGDIMIKFIAAEDRIARASLDKVTERVTEAERKLLSLLLEDPAYTYASLAEKLGVSRKTISSRIKSLKDKGVLQRVGSDTKGHWQIKNGK